MNRRVQTWYDLRWCMKEVNVPNKKTGIHPTARGKGICHPIVVGCARTINKIKQQQPGHATQQESRCRQSKTVKLASKSKFSNVIHSSDPLANIKNGIRTFFLTEKIDPLAQLYPTWGNSPSRCLWRKLDSRPGSLGGVEVSPWHWEVVRCSWYLRELRGDSTTKHYILRIVSWRFSQKLDGSELNLRS